MVSRAIHFWYFFLRRPEEVTVSFSIPRGKTLSRSAKPSQYPPVLVYLSHCIRSCFVRPPSSTMSWEQCKESSSHPLQPLQPLPFSCHLNQATVPHRTRSYGAHAAQIARPLSGDPGGAAVVANDAPAVPAVVTPSIYLPRLKTTVTEQTGTRRSWRARTHEEVLLH